MAAGVAVALDAPVMAVTAGPHEAEALAADLEAYLGAERVALLPAWEALPYEGISPAPEVAARRAGAIARLREAQGPFVLVAPALAAMQGMIPTLGTVAAAGTGGRARNSRPTPSPSDSWTWATRAPTSSSTGVSSRCAAASSTSSPATARRPVRLEFWATRSSRCASSCRRPSCPPTGSRTGDVPPVRELIPDDALRARAARARRSARGPVRRSAAAPRGRVVRRGRGDARAVAVRPRCRRRRSCCPRAPGWSVSHRSARSTGRARRTRRPRRWPTRSAGRCRACCIRSTTRCGDRVQLRLTEFTEGVDLGWATGARRRATRASWRTVSAISPRRATGWCVSARGHGSLDRVREVVGDLAVETVEAPLATGFVFRRASSPSPPRRTCSARAGTPGRRRASRAGADRVDRRRAGAGRLRRPPDPRRGPLRRASRTASSPAPNATT